MRTNVGPGFNILFLLYQTLLSVLVTAILILFVKKNKFIYLHGSLHYRCCFVFCESALFKKKNLTILDSSSTFNFCLQLFSFQKKDPNFWFLILVMKCSIKEKLATTSARYFFCSCSDVLIFLPRNAIISPSLLRGVYFAEFGTRKKLFRFSSRPLRIHEVLCAKQL